MTAFEALDPSLQYHVVNTLGWPSLRPLQEAAIAPLLAGDHALLIAPTAGGKTEAAVLPLLSRMLSEDWPALSVLYVCPLRALLNDLHQRLERFGGLLGRRVGIWHGDVSAAAKTAIRRSPPDLLLTTPESLESMLVSARLDAREFFHRLRALVVDEIHAFAGDDRGWHLLSVAGRIERMARCELQRVGLSATVGNPRALLDWLAGPAQRPRRVIVDPGTAKVKPPEVELDWVGNLDNAARVIAALHRGEKRLVFCDSRARTEELAHALGSAGVTTWVSHSSLAREIRLHSEQAFAASSTGVIVATSTLELGIDIGDLDRVIQIDAPGRVASFLQRLGRTGRRPGVHSNCLFLTTHPQAFLRAAAIVQLWSEGFVEPVVPPPEPFHVLAQQLMALCLQERGELAADAWRSWLMAMPGFAALDAGSVDQLAAFLLGEAILWQDGGRLWLGSESERRYRRRNFLELLSMITDSPLFLVFHGNQEIGQVDRASFVVQPEQTPVLLLAGRSWRVEHIDWRRKRCWVRAADNGGKSRWVGEGQALSFDLCQAIRRILSGQATPPGLTRRGRARLDEARDDFPWLAATDAATVFEPLGSDQERWWTFAGLIGNATVLGLLRAHLSRPGRYDNLSIVLPRADAEEVRRRLAGGELEVASDAMPQVDRRAVEALKFGDCLPRDLLRRVVKARWSDVRAVRHMLGPTTLLHASAS